MTNDCDPIRHLGVHAAVRPIAGQADLPALIVALLRADLEPGAAVWLDEAQRFFNGQHGGDVARALHRMLDLAPQPEPKRVVTGSFWPSELWLSPDDDEQAVRDLLARPGVTVPVCEAFPFPERVERAAQWHPRWRAALATNGGVNLVQFLTGGPSLVRDLEKGRYGADAGALLAAAMDAHRIGFWSPLPVAMLAQAASEHWRPRQGAPIVDLAAADAMSLVCGVRALTHTVGHEHAAVMLHSYLAQHAREARRREAVPDSLWAAVTSVVDGAGDSERVFDSTLHRGLLRWHLTLLRRRADAGDDTAAQQLAELLPVRGDLGAVAGLRARPRPGCSRAADFLAERGEGRLVELLLQRGDPEAEAWLRDCADNGDVVVARRFAELLFQNGGRDAVGELRIRADWGESHPATLLVELLAGWRDADAVAELRVRADDNVGAATGSVETLYESGGVEELAELRKRAEDGDQSSADHLTQLLYRRGDEAAAVELRQRAAAGDHNAARLLVCMLHERGGQDACAELRELTQAGDRFAAEHLVELLCERGDPESLDEVRERVNAGDGYAATLLVELLVERGDHDAVVELRALSETGDRYATELLVAMGDRATADVVRARARSGDRTAVDLVVERLVDPGDPAAVAELQTYSAAGNGYATELLIRVLFNLGDESAATALRAYAEYGNDSAAVMLVRLLFDRGDQKAVEELRARSDAGDRYAEQRLADLLAGRQDPEAVAEPAHTCRRW